MNIIYVDNNNTEVPFDSIVDGQCFDWDGFIYMKFHEKYNGINAINLESGTVRFFDDETAVIPVYAELYVTGYNKEKT